LPIRAKLIGEKSQRVVVRDAAGKPAALSGYTQGWREILDPDGNVIFEGRYYDTRTYQALPGDDGCCYNPRMLDLIRDLSGRPKMN
jgi:hypothetical protein